MRPPQSGILVAFIPLLLGSCGTASGGRAISAAGDVVGRALSGSRTSEKPSAWSLNEARCGIFSEHRIACPTLRNCGALFGSAEPALTVNVCVDDMGDLDPVKWCSYGSHWCRASDFPACASARQWPCDDFDTLVCEDPTEERRLLRSQIDAISGACSYQLVMRHDEAEDSSTTDAGETSRAPQGTAAPDAGGSAQGAEEVP